MAKIWDQLVTSVKNALTFVQGDNEFGRSTASTNAKSGEPSGFRTVTDTTNLPVDATFAGVPYHNIRVKANNSVDGNPNWIFDLFSHYATGAIYENNCNNVGVWLGYKRVHSNRWFSVKETMNPVNGEGLIYNSTTGQWENGVLPTGTGTGSSAWGSITGTLSTQADLQAALNAKEAKLNNPTVDGQTLVSTIAGVRSWATPAAGGGGASLSTANTWTAKQTFSPTLPSGTPSALEIAFLVNQSGSDGYDGIMVNANITTAGSGEKNLMNLRKNGNSKVRANDDGIVYATQFIPTGFAGVNQGLIRYGADFLIAAFGSAGGIQVQNSSGVNFFYSNSSGTIINDNGNISPSASVVFDVKSNAKGSRPFPSMTAAQKNAIPTPAIGSHIYQTDATEGVYVYKSSGTWVFAY